MTETKAVDIARLNDLELRDIKSFDDAVNVLANAGVAVVDVTEYGTGFEVTPKVELLNVPFVILDAKVVPGEKSDTGKPFLVVFALTNTNKKCILTDGSTGMYAQSEKIGVSNLIGTVHKKGLTASEYDYVNDKGEHSPAKTYYFVGI